jgi:23S rRNA pseudouridine1911/1915/1917 synthase
MPQDVSPLLAPEVIYQDDELLVINKPAGLIVEDSHTHSQHTLEQWLAQTSQLDRSGMVHRLDKDTSGVMVVAKTVDAQEKLQQQFKDRQVAKEYQALVWGKAPEQHAIIDAPIARHPAKGFKYVAMAGGRPAKTEFWLEQGYSFEQQLLSLLRVKPYTGRTHQIRVHLAALNLPIVGDRIYGRRKDKTPIRQFLHAHHLSFTHPKTGESVHFSAPLPVDLQEFLNTLSPVSAVDE